jgi:hypothetical protein
MILNISNFINASFKNYIFDYNDYKFMISLINLKLSTYS